MNNIFSGFGLTGNANFDPMQMNQNTQMLRQEVGNWLQQQNNQLSMQAAQNPQAAQLLRNVNEATNDLLHDPILPMLQQIETLLQTAPQPIQKVLKDRIVESFEDAPKLGKMRRSSSYGSSGYGTPMTTRSPSYGSSGYGTPMGTGMGSPSYGSSGYGTPMGTVSPSYASSGYGTPKKNSFFGGKIGRKSRKMTRTTGVKRGGYYNKMKGGTCKNR